jgi:hypothetical protein
VADLPLVIVDPEAGEEAPETEGDNEAVGILLVFVLAL